jgi:hypothetical protein
MVGHAEVRSDLLGDLDFEPVPLPWAQLRASLPPAIELPDPEDETGDDEGLFKRIDRVTPNELQQHLNTRIGQLILDIEHYLQIALKKH